MKTHLAVAFAVLLAGPAGVALAGAPPAPTPGVPEGVQIPKDWVQCPRCQRHHQPDWVCCCTVCGGTHPKSLKCRRETTAARRDAKCPVCEHRFTGPLPFGRNSRGGVDRDFCRHSLGQGVVESLVWMCPRCGYANFCPIQRPDGEVIPGDFNKKLDARAVARIKAELKPLLEKSYRAMAGNLAEMFQDADQTEIPEWLKYQMAVKSADLIGAPAEERAKLALEGSYACRRAQLAPISMPMLSVTITTCEGRLRRMCGDDREPRVVMRALTDMLIASEKAAAGGGGGGLAVDKRFYFYLRLSGCYDRTGETVLAAESLEEAGKTIGAFRADPRLLESLSALVASRLRLLKMESEFRAEAIRQMRKALVEDDAYPGGAVLPTAYLLGELCRREGAFGKAGAWLTLAAKMAPPKHAVSAWVAEALAMPDMKTANFDREENTVILNFVARMTGKTPEELIAKTPDEPEPAETSDAAPETCAQALAGIHRAYLAYVEKNARAPAELVFLVRDGFITDLASGGFKCPECGARLGYRPLSGTKLRAPGELLVWHARSSTCKRLVLYADGSVEERK